MTLEELIEMLSERNYEVSKLYDAFVDTDMLLNAVKELKTKALLHKIGVYDLNHIDKILYIVLKSTFALSENKETVVEAK